MYRKHSSLPKLVKTHHYEIADDTQLARRRQNVKEIIHRPSSGPIPHEVHPAPHHTHGKKIHEIIKT